MRARPQRSILRNAVVKIAKADEIIRERTLWTQWRDPWEEINVKLEPVLSELGFTHVVIRDDSKRFATLPDRVLAALAELRNLRELRAKERPCE